jgi:uncharacterized membrane protein YjjB (DUF3815 family)
MYFVFCVAITALCFMVYNNAREKNIPLVVVSLILPGVAITLVINVLTRLTKVAEA